jgi:hypothetical protein
LDAEEVEGFADEEVAAKYEKKGDAGGSMRHDDGYINQSLYQLLAFEVGSGEEIGQGNTEKETD